MAVMPVLENVAGIVSVRTYRHNNELFGEITITGDIVIVRLGSYAIEITFDNGMSAMKFALGTDDDIA